MRRFVPVLAALLVLGAPAMAVAGAQKVATKTSAAYSVQESSLGTLLDDPVAKAIVAKYAPTVVADPRVEMARPLTLAQLQRFGGDALNDDVLAKIDVALKAAAPK